MHPVTVSGAENLTFSFTHSVCVCVHLFVFTPVYASANVSNIWVCLSLSTHPCECFGECARVYVCVWNREEDGCIYFFKKSFERVFEYVWGRPCQIVSKQMATRWIFFSFKFYGLPSFVVKGWVHFGEHLFLHFLSRPHLPSLSPPPTLPFSPGYWPLASLSPTTRWLHPHPWQFDGCLASSRAADPSRECGAAGRDKHRDAVINKRRVQPSPRSSVCPSPPIHIAGWKKITHCLPPHF